MNVEESPRSLRDRYVEALPKSLIGTALAPSSVPAPMRYNAVVVDHHDADTFYVNMSFGIFGLIAERQSIRILGMAARELSALGGKEARDALKKRPGMTVGSPVVLTAVNYDKWGGRLDAVVSYLAADGTAHDLATDLIMDQWAVPWNGQGTQPQPPWPRTV